jgi:hypothetical protein
MDGQALASPPGAAGVLVRGMRWRTEQPHLDRQEHQGAEGFDEGQAFIGRRSPISCHCTPATPSRWSRRRAL